jgi:hypothetical protein
LNSSSKVSEKPDKLSIEGSSLCNRRDLDPGW